MSDELNKKKDGDDLPELEVDTDPGDDVSFEEEIENTGGDHKKKFDNLKTKLKEAEEKAASYLDSWQRDKADFINIRKRDEQAQKEFIKFANEKLILEIIPVLDSFDMALLNKEALKNVPNEWLKGVEYIHSQLISVLENNGVKRIYPLHEKFDPTRDEAMTTVKVENEKDEDKVMEIIQTGYEYNGKIIRTVKVKVGEK